MLDSIVQNRQERVDSLLDNIVQPIQELTSSLDSIPTGIEQSVRKHLDSTIHDAQSAVNLAISPLDSAADSYIDTIQVRSNRLKQAASQRMDSLIAPLRQRYDTLQNHVKSIQEKTSIDLPTSLDNSTIQENIPKLPSLSPPDFTEQFPSFEELHTTLPERIPKLEGFDQLKSLKGTASEYVQQASGAVEQATAAVKDAPATLEQQASRLSEVQVLQEQQSALETWKKQPLGQQPHQYQQQAEGYLDPETMPGQIKQELKKQAKNHFSEQTESLEQGQQKLGELKQKYSQVQSEKEFYRKATSLRGEGWGSRLHIGTFFQLHREPSLAIDLSPFVGYRFNTRWSAGIGTNFNVSQLQQSIYGARGYVESFFHKTFFLHAEYEHTYVAPRLPNENPSNWESAYLFGIGKEYAITHRVKGIVLLLHNFADSSLKNYLPQWNIRMGFSLARKAQ